MFNVNHIELSDGNSLWEVVTEDGERIASATTPQPCRDLAATLNDALSHFHRLDVHDHVLA